MKSQLIKVKVNKKKYNKKNVIILEEKVTKNTVRAL